MTGRSFKTYLPLLKFLTKKRISKENFVSIISCLDEGTIKFLCECVHNAISFKYVSKLERNKRSTLLRKILPYKRAIKYLCKKGKKLNTRKKLIIQKGYEFLFPILSVIIPLVTSLLRSWLETIIDLRTSRKDTD